jgi:hypothetical protein
MSTDCGTLTPRSLAALRSMPRSNLVGCWIGSPAGFALHVARARHIDKDREYAERAVGLFFLAAPRSPSWVGGICEFAHACGAWEDFAEQLNSLDIELRRGGGTGDVAARSRQAPHETDSDRIPGAMNNDRDSPGGSLRRNRGSCTQSDDYFDLDSYQLLGHSIQEFSTPSGVATLDAEILVFDPSELPQWAPQPGIALRIKGRSGR